MYINNYRCNVLLMLNDRGGTEHIFYGFYALLISSCVNVNAGSFLVMVPL